MNIVFVGTFALAPKSTMRARALPLAQALVRRGHRVTLALPPWDNPEHSRTAWEDEGVAIINVSLPPRIPLAWYGLLTWRLWQQVGALRPDAVHAFKPKGFSGLVAQLLLAQRALGVGQARVLVDTDDWEGAGGWNDREPYPWWQRRGFAYQEAWLLRHADAVTAASRTLADRAAQTRGSSARVYYVPNGTPFPLPEPDEPSCRQLRERLGLTSGPVALLYTRFVEFAPERAVSLLHAVAACVEGLTLLLVGKGLHGEEERFLSVAGEGGLPLRIVNAGWVEQEALPQYFALADVALFPMDDTLLNRAKCPAKLVDLLSAGVPVVAEAVGQAQAYIQDRRTGLLVPPGDTQAFAAAVSALLHDEGQRRSMGQEAKKKMATEYTWDRLAARFEEAYTT